MFLVKLSSKSDDLRPMHSAQAQSVRVTKKDILVLLVTIAETLQEVRINVYFIIDSYSEVPMFWAIGRYIAR